MTPLLPDDEDISLVVDCGGCGGVRVVCVPAVLVLLLCGTCISASTIDVFSSAVRATACDKGIVIVFELLLSDATLTDFWSSGFLFEWGTAICLFVFFGISQKLPLFTAHFPRYSVTTFLPVLMDFFTYTNTQIFFLFIDFTYPT